MFFDGICFLLYNIYLLHAKNHLSYHIFIIYRIIYLMYISYISQKNLKQNVCFLVSNHFSAYDLMKYLRSFIKILEIFFDSIYFNDIIFA